MQVAHNSARDDRNPVPTIIKGQPTSIEVLDKLAAEDKPILLAFSCGKDSIATWLALKDAGITDIRPAYLYGIPDLAFIDNQLKYFEDVFQTRIAQYPHPSLYRQLNNFLYQPPDRIPLIRAAKLPNIDYLDLWDTIRRELDVAPDTWVADGVRASDSPGRRMACVRHGVMKAHNTYGRGVYKVSPIADWYLREVRARIDAAKIKLPVDYEWFGRSFDGIDYRFLKPIRDHAPEDYQRILDYFPLADLEILRNEMSEA